MSRNHLSSLEMNTLNTLKSELYSLKMKNQPSNQEQVVIDWMEDRITKMMEKA